MTPQPSAPTQERPDDGCECDGLSSIQPLVEQNKQKTLVNAPFDSLRLTRMKTFQISSRSSTHGSAVVVRHTHAAETSGFASEALTEADASGATALRKRHEPNAQHIKNKQSFKRRIKKRTIRLGPKGGDSPRTFVVSFRVQCPPPDFTSFFSCVCVCPCVCVIRMIPHNSFVRKPPTISYTHTTSNRQPVKHSSSIETTLCAFQFSSRRHCMWFVRCSVLMPCS